MAIFRPRASRIAPREAAAMPLPNEDTTPPVTNTKRVKVVNLNCVCARKPSREKPGAGDGPLEGPGSTGRQIIKSQRVSEDENGRHAPSRPRRPRQSRTGRRG